MSTPRIEPFVKLYAGELDEDTAVANLTARDAILTSKRFLWMSVRDNSTGFLYQLQGGIANENWVDITLENAISRAIVAGQYITISGDGSEADPYVIEQSDAQRAVDGVLYEIPDGGNVIINPPQLIESQFGMNYVTVRLLGATGTFVQAGQEVLYTMPVVAQQIGAEVIFTRFTQNYGASWTIIGIEPASTTVLPVPVVDYSVLNALGPAAPTVYQNIILLVSGLVTDFDGAAGAVNPAMYYRADRLCPFGASPEIVFRQLTNNGASTSATGEASAAVARQIIAFPANFLRVGDIIEFSITVTKVGTNGTGTLVARAGSLGTVGDALVFNIPSAPSAINLVYALSNQRFKVLSNTSIQGVAGQANNTSAQVQTGTSAVSPPVITVPDITTNPLILSFTPFVADALDSVAVTHNRVSAHLER